MLNQLLYTLLPIFIGILLIGFNHHRKLNRKNSSFENADGIVFDLSEQPSINSNSFNKCTILNVRFMTNKEEWITKEISVNKRSYKKGQKVKLFYAPENPVEFILEGDILSKKAPKHILTIAGIAAIGYGLFNTYQYKLGELFNN